MCALPTCMHWLWALGILSDASTCSTQPQTEAAAAAHCAALAALTTATIRDWQLAPTCTHFPVSNHNACKEAGRGHN